MRPSWLPSDATSEASTHKCLEDIAQKTIWEAIGEGVFGDIRRARDGGKGYRGVMPRHAAYLNPFLAALEG